MADHRADLYSRIQLEIKRWKLIDKRPPYTGKQLAAMALLSTEKPLSFNEIQDWMVENFKCSEPRGEIVSFSDLESLTDFEVGEKDSDLTHEVKQALQAFDSPIEVHEAEDLDRFTISAADGERMLGPLIAEPEAASGTSFPFFDLPAELRQYIYELVFGFPKSGLALRSSEVRARFDGLTRNFATPFSFDDWDGYLLQSKRTRPETDDISQILAPLLVNRQFYNEAMPVFYKTNNFYFRRLPILEEFLCNTPPSRLKHVREISVVYGLRDSREAASTFKGLDALENPRILRIRIDEERWSRHGARTGYKKYQSIEKMPGLRTLRSIKVNKVHFDKCHTIEKMLKADMEKPRPPKKTKYPAKKRKAEGAEEEASSAKRSGKGKKAKKTSFSADYMSLLISDE